MIAPLPQDGRYRVIYADPPWRFKVRHRRSGLRKSPDRHYPTMTLPQLIAVPVAGAASRDSLLAMWVYDPMLPRAIELAQAWGFDFCTVLFRWFKTVETGGATSPPRFEFGLGYHTRGGGCEECWLFKRGRGRPVLRHDIPREFCAPAREHSRKPEEVAGWLVDLYGNGPRLDLFARQRRRGWDAWGNQVDRFSAGSPAVHVAMEGSR